MNLLITIFVVLLICAFLEIMLSKMPRLQTNLFHIVFVLTYVLFTIKYYYGPDVFMYVPHYADVPILTQFWNSGYEPHFEIGYELFCSLLKTLGVSFWGMTAVVSTIYFIAIYLILQHINQYKTFALFVIVLLDYVLIFSTFRQCLAVSFFIFMVLTFWNKQYTYSLVWCIAAMLLHKSAIIICPPIWLAMNFRHINIDSNIYHALLIFLCISLVIPLTNIFSAIVDFLPIGQSFASSIEHHLLGAKQVQSVFALYFLLLLLLTYQTEYNVHYKRLQWLLVTAAILIAIFYQDFHLLNRLRSYFIPFMVLYVFNSDTESLGLKHNSVHRLMQTRFLKQCLALTFFIYATYIIYAQYQFQNSFKSHIFDTCTIFDVRHASQQQLEEKQLAKCKLYWEEEYLTKVL